jgi:hypothetical protein
MGVTQVLNKRSGTFTEIDAALVEAINRQAANALNQASTTLAESICASVFQGFVFGSMGTAETAAEG